MGEILTLRLGSRNMTGYCCEIALSLSNPLATVVYDNACSQQSCALFSSDGRSRTGPSSIACVDMGPSTVTSVGGNIMRNPARSHLALILLVGMALLGMQPAKAQTFSVLYAFHGGQDGAVPFAGLTKDGRGNLYGTTSQGGHLNEGVVFQLLHRGSGWAVNPLHVFNGQGDGAAPKARVIFGPDGTLYGTTAEGGSGLGGGYGTVFNLRPPSTVCKTVQCPWLETVIYRFQGGNDGTSPFSDPAFDRNGNLYGTTYRGGGSDCGGEGCGTVVQLSSSDGGWTESIIYNGFSSTGPQGYDPAYGVVVDNAGNLYGTTNSAVYELSPSGSGWIETTIAELEPGGIPSGLIMDASGNLYGAGVNSVFELSPAGGGWRYQTLYTFDPNEAGPFGTLTMDAAGNLYGASLFGGPLLDSAGFVFKLSPSQSGWTFTDLHDFTVGSNGGWFPMCQLLLDGEGNIYGTASYGGDLTSCSGDGCGVVFEITP